MPSRIFISTMLGNHQLTSFDDLENKGFWCSITEQKEKAFAQVTKKINNFPWNIEIHPNKIRDPYHPDLICNCGYGDQVGELKIKNSPLFFAKKLYGINPQHALTMDLKDSFNYRRWLSKGIDIQIFIWVKWEAHRLQTWGNDINNLTNYDVSPMKGIWTTKFSTLLAFEQQNKPPIHWYKNRQALSLDFNSPEAQELLSFDNRLQIDATTVKSITSGGFIKSNGIFYPSGNSSASYVFDLSNTNLFENLCSRVGYPY